jgi:hypothetical protein
MGYKMKKTKIKDCRRNIQINISNKGIYSSVLKRDSESGSKSRISGRDRNFLLAPEFQVALKPKVERCTKSDIVAFRTLIGFTIVIVKNREFQMGSN